jgi:exosortase
LSRFAFLGPLAIVFVVALVAYSPVLAELFRDWVRDSNYSHGFLIPVVSAYLLWSKRGALKATGRRPFDPGVVAIAGALSLWVLGTAAAEVFVQRVSFLALLAAIVLFMAGRAWLRQAAFPIAFLLLAIPMPYVLYYSLTGSMQAFAAQGAVAGLQAVGVPAQIQGNMIHLPEGSLEVAEACSGIRSLYAFLALGALLARSVAIPVWGRILLFLVTIPLSVAGNALRVWSTGLGAHLVSPTAVTGVAHELFGVFVFAGGLLMFLLVRRGARALWSSAP